MTAQTEINFARQSRDKGIKKAITHADRVHDKWGDRVFEAFKEYLIIMQKQPFQIEDFREWIGDKIPPPPHNRAFGAIVIRAIKAGLIWRAGFAPVKNPKAHRAIGAVWLRV